MARFTFGGYGGDQVSIDPTQNNGFFRAALNLSATGTFWSASTGGTQYTDLVDPNTNAALTGVSSSSKGLVVPFKGPDGVVEGWLDFGAGRFKVTAVDSMDSQTASLFGSATSTRGAADGRYSQKPAAAEKVVFVTARGSDTNDGSTLATALATVSAAITALGGPGRIQLGMGSINFGSTIVLDSTTNITIEGCGGVSAGASPATTLIFTGTGSGAAISAQHSVGLTFKGIQFLYSSSSFTGRFLDARNGTPGSRGNDTNFLEIIDCYFGGASSIRTCDALVDLDGATGITIRDSHFRDAVNGIRGQAAAGSYANIVKIQRCYFRNLTTAPIRNPGDGWTVDTCTGEPLASGAAGFVLCDSGVATNGFTVLGGWLGDVVASAGGIQFDLTGNNIYIFGTTIGGNSGSTGVKIRNAANGVIIAASINGPTTGIDVSGVIPTNYDFSKSNFINCTTPLTSGYPRASFETPGGVPALFLHNGATVSGDATARFKADKTSVQQYDLGIDPGGGTSKAFQLRDLTASGAPIRLTVTPAGSFIAGVSAPATTATDGFVYIPVTAGTPTGTPTVQTGYVPMMADSTGSKLWVYIGGAWKSTTLA